MLQASTWADRFLNYIERKGEFTEQDLNWLYRNKNTLDGRTHDRVDEDYWEQWSEEARKILPTKVSRLDYWEDTNNALRNDEPSNVANSKMLAIWVVVGAGKAADDPNARQIELEMGSSSSIVFEDV